MRDCTSWEGAGDGGGTCHTSCRIFHKREETAPCENTLAAGGAGDRGESLLHHCCINHPEEIELCQIIFIVEMTFSVALCYTHFVDLLVRIAKLVVPDESRTKD
jgi:hypothetical protein